MARGFLSGAALGAIVSGLGLAGLSVMTAPPAVKTQDGQIGEPVIVAPEIADQTPAPATPDTSETVAPAAPDAEASDVEGHETDAGTDGAPEAGEEAASDPAPAAAPIDPGPSPAAPNTPVVTDEAPGNTAPNPDSALVREGSPDTPQKPMVDTTPPELPDGPAAQVEDRAPDGGVPPVTPGGAEADLKIALEDLQPRLPETPSITENGTAMPQVSDIETSPPATPDAALAIAAGEGETADVPAPTEEAAQDSTPPGIKSAPLAPIGDLADNVTTNRLPTITQEDAPEAGAADDAAAAPEDGEQEAAPRAIIRNGVPFDITKDLPVMAILLQDQGAQRAQLGDLSSLPFSVTFVVDAIAPDAEEAIAFYKAAGAEVVIAASLPPEATPTDAEVNFQVQDDILAQGSAVLMLTESGFQERSDLAQQVAEILLASGHGVISQPKGLNTGHRLAVKAGVPAGVIFRDVDGAGQDGRAIRRFLDNAAFKARQKEGVIVYGRARPETLQSLIEWSLGNRAKSVSVAPVSAVLLGE